MNFFEKFKEDLVSDDLTVRNNAIWRGVDVFTLSATLGHSSTGTTSNYVLAEHGESSSLKLG